MSHSFGISFVGIGKNKSDSEINASPDGKNDLSLVMSVDNFRLNWLKVR
jgi:hypothetical protein